MRAFAGVNRDAGFGGVAIECEDEQVLAGGKIQACRSLLAGHHAIDGDRRAFGHGAGDDPALSLTQLRQFGVKVSGLAGLDLHLRRVGLKSRLGYGDAIGSRGKIDCRGSLSELALAVYKDVGAGRLAGDGERGDGACGGGRGRGS